MSTLTIDELTAELLRTGVVPPRAVFDGSLSVIDISSRNRNYRVSWSDGAGIVLKQPDPLDPTTAVSLRNEVSFYAACARAANDVAELPLPKPFHGLACSQPALALELVRDGVALWRYRKEGSEPTAAYAALGRALATFHRFAASEQFREEAFVRDLTNTLQWSLALHKPAVASLRTLSGVQMKFFRMLQRETLIGEHLDRLASKLQASTIIHGDLKADNILVTDRPSTRVTLIDWELVRHGDPAWDVGAVLQDLFASWLEALAPSSDTDMRTLIANDPHPLRELQPSFRAFWAAYAATSELNPVVRDDLLGRAVECSAAVFVQRAFENAQGGIEQVPNHSIMMLQVASNIFAAPARASLFLYGIPLASRRRPIAPSKAPRATRQRSTSSRSRGASRSPLGIASWSVERRPCSKKSPTSSEHS